MNIILVMTLTLTTPSLTTTRAFPEVFRHQAHDVLSGPQLVVPFTLTNTSQQHIRIVDVVSNCGCSRPTASINEVPPGGSTIIGVSIHTLTQAPGKHRWKTVVRYHEVGKPQLVHDSALELDATIVPYLEVNPAQIALSTATVAEQKIVLKKADGKPIRILEIISSHTAITAKLLTKDSQASHELFMNLNAESLTGITEHVLTVTTDDPLIPLIRIPIRVEKRQATALSVYPTELQCDFASGTKQTSKVVQFRSTNGTPIKILKLTADNPAITFRYDPEATAQVLNARVLIEATTSGQATVTAETSAGKIIIPVAWVVRQ